MKFKVKPRSNVPVKIYKTIGLLFALCFYNNIYGQNQLVTIYGNNQTLIKIFQQIEKQTSLSISYNATRLDVKRKIKENYVNKTLSFVMDNLLKNTGNVWQIEQEHIVISPVIQDKKQDATKSGQKRKITGKVSGQAGEPLIGANITVLDSPNLATITDVDGNFVLEIPDNSTLNVSYIGYLGQKIKIAGKSYLNIVLEEDSQTLNEIVVVGYGSQKKANLTGSIATVKMDDIASNRPLLNVSDALQGVVPGLMVSSNGNDPGNSKKFQIRGAYSVGIKNDDGTYGNTISPLILIDNVEGNIDMLNPEDIESVTVLKDAASAAIYGARAAGGVILITTKQAKSGTAFQLNYNNNIGFSRAINLPRQAPLMDYLKAYSDAAGDEFWTGRASVSKWMQYLSEYQKDPSSISTVGDGIFKDSDGALYYLNEKDLIKNMLDNGFQMTHNLSASGGTDKLRYRLSGSYVTSDGVLITDKDKYKRLNINAFISADITKWFTQEANISYAHSHKSLPESTLFEGFYSLRLASFYPEGNMPKEISGASQDLPLFTPRNQILWANSSKTLNDNPRIFLKSIIKPFKGFEAVFEYTFDKHIYDYHWYTGSTTYATIESGNNITPAKGEDYLRKKKQYTDYNSFNIYGTYNLDIGNHKLKFMTGFNQESSYLELLDVYSYGQAAVEVPAMGSGTSTIKATDSYSEYAIRGGYFRANYSYLDKYLLEINGRYDGSSKFPKNSRFSFNPSISGGWQIAEEKFMEPARNWLDGLKLRASYGVIGNQNVPPYAFIPTMDVNNKFSGWLANGTYVTAVTTLPALVSSSFTWEKVHNLDLGLDVTLFQNRLNATLGWYQRQTLGMLAPGIDLPAIVGASAPYQNTADMRTRGWEAALNWRDRIGKVSYSIGFNLTDNQSEITKYDANTSKILTDSNGRALFYKGQQLGDIWGYVADGFYTVNDFESTSTWKLNDGIARLDGYNPRPGDLKFKNLRDDERGNNVISSGDNTADNPGDRKIIGNNTPRYLYGINLGGSYAGFDLNIFMQGTGKRDTWISNVLVFPLYNDFKFIPLYEGLNDYWQPIDAANNNYEAVNPNAKYPRIYENYGNSASNYRQSDKYLMNASYFRIKNVTLSYTVPKRWINSISLKQLKGFVSVENLATFSSLPKGIDPETLIWKYPAFRTVSFGINLTL